MYNINKYLPMTGLGSDHSTNWATTTAFVAILPQITFYVKTAVATFGALFEKIGLLFIPASGHTAWY